MADSQFKTQISRDENANTTSNVIFVQLADNGGNGVTVTGNKLDVNATVNLENSYPDDSAFTIGTDEVAACGYLADETAPDSVDEGDIGLARMTLDRKILTVLVDPTTDGNRLGIDASGYITSNINGTVTIDANSSDVTVDNGAGASAVNIQDGGNSITIDDGGGAITVDGSVTVSGTVTVTATDLDIRDLAHTQDSVALGDGTGVLVDVLDSTVDALYVALTDGTETLAINTDGSINVAPSPVVGGTTVHDYDTATPAAGASDNHDYTVTASSTLYLQKVSWAGSGKTKVEVQVGPVASLATVYVGFAEKDTNNEIEFTPAIPVPDTGTGTVRVIRTNRQGAAVDVYSTIMGQEL
jgi:hypothetical protein